VRCLANEEYKKDQINKNHMWSNLLSVLEFDLQKSKFTGKVILNFHKGNISKKYEISKTEELA
jgi:hypothetical protein